MGKFILWVCVSYGMVSHSGKFVNLGGNILLWFNYWLLDYYKIIHIEQQLCSDNLC